MLFSYVPFGVTVMVLGCPDYLHLTGWVLQELKCYLPQLWQITCHLTSRECHSSVLNQSLNLNFSEPDQSSVQGLVVVQNWTTGSVLGSDKVQNLWTLLNLVRTKLFFDVYFIHLPIWRTKFCFVCHGQVYNSLDASNCNQIVNFRTIWVVRGMIDMLDGGC